MLILLSLVACSGKAPVSAEHATELQTEADSVEAAPVVLASQGCSELDEQACYTSPDCILTLDVTDDGTICRAASNPCEAGFVQADVTTCPTERGCEVVPAVCYCPPTVQCICGGGEPPGCAQVWADSPPLPE